MIVTDKLARGPGGAAQQHRYLVDGVEVPGGNTDHEVVGSVVGHGEAASVEPVKGDDCRQCEPLVAIDESTTTGDRVEQRSSLASRSG